MASADEEAGRGAVCNGCDANRIVFAHRCVAPRESAAWIPAGVSGKHHPVCELAEGRGEEGVITEATLGTRERAYAMSAPESW